MSNQSTLCPACLSKNVAMLTAIKNFPAILFPIEQDKRRQVAAGDLSVYMCQSCGHGFLVDLDVEFNNRLYVDYYYLYPFSSLESMNPHYRAPFEKVFDLYVKGGAGEKLLEIGCSDERQFDGFIARGFDCVGVSPGASTGKRVTLVDGYYERTPLNQKFSVIVSRFNLEHIISPDPYLEKVRSELSEGGLFIAQVPNYDFFIQAGIICSFAHEHPQYFSEKSLRVLLERLGFQVDLLWGTGHPSLIVVARKNGPSADMSVQARKNLSYVDQVADLLRLNEGKRFLFYGASLSLAGLLYTDKRIEPYMDRLDLVDDNKLLHGKFMPCTDLVVHPFSADLAGDNTIVVLILSQIYHSAVLQKVVSAKPSAVYALESAGLRRLT